ncbi:glycosyltransferase [Spiribacter halobius]|uniref:glycosyltransferase n=1 Tax=Sediminicurvatus halobius TaxID=2182432 RepID=UPI001E2CDCAE|nr:glycosyltransferase [Spiribacter halobius]UEX78243.1 glycosyltransferase [Spiribacter halobius]
MGIFAPSLGDGGVERMLINLAGGFNKLGLTVSLACATDSPPYLDRTSASPLLQIWHLGRTAPIRDEAERWLRHTGCDVTLSAKDRDCRILLEARNRSRLPIPVIYRCGTDLRARLAGRSAFRRWRERRRVRQLLGGVDGVTGNSVGVCNSMDAFGALTPSRLIRNPVITDALLEATSRPPRHPWLRQKAGPVIVAVGRLASVKDFPTLLEAFAMLPREMGARLIILGEGRCRQRLESLTRSLGLEDTVSMPGFTADPYPEVAASDALIVSSRREGSPNALIEAMALGVPVAATDCPSGPAEILDQGRWGPLVPVGDPHALHLAIRQILDRPVPTERLREAVSDYREEASAEAYLDFFRSLQSHFTPGH